MEMFILIPLPLVVASLRHDHYCKRTGPSIPQRYLGVNSAIIYVHFNPPRQLIYTLPSAMQMDTLLAYLIANTVTK